jgi:hypothetical protein
MPTTLEYTLLSSEGGEVYRPMAGLEVRFTFLEGEEIIAASGGPDGDSTGECGVFDFVHGILQDIFNWKIDE